VLARPNGGGFNFEEAIPMHMADALISPAVGGTMWIATAGMTALSAKKLKEDMDDSKVPLMGVLGAFIFAAQMVNFTIPGTGSSGHLAGAMILSILIGPYAAFITMASIITIQALFFADGGILALGCNIFNMAFFSCFIAYPLIYKKIAGEHPTRKRILTGAMAASIAGLAMGAIGVVLETGFSGISDLPLSTFFLLMLPIHLAIGVVEGLITTAVVTFIWQARPEVMAMASTSKAAGSVSFRKVVAGIFIAAAVTGGFVSWFASTNPDGLEWSMLRTSGKEELEAPSNGIHSLFASLQEKLSFLPDYGFSAPEAKEGSAASAEVSGTSGKSEEPWAAAHAGKSLAGLVGGALTMILAGVIGIGLRRHRQKAR
jgi:cobalt/nickel transport system permease protein